MFAFCFIRSDMKWWSRARGQPALLPTRLHQFVRLRSKVITFVSLVLCLSYFFFSTYFIRNSVLFSNIMGHCFLTFRRNSFILSIEVTYAYIQCLRYLICFLLRFFLYQYEYISYNDNEIFLTNLSTFIFNELAIGRFSLHWKAMSCICKIWIFILSIKDKHIIYTI